MPSLEQVWDQTLPPTLLNRLELLEAEVLRLNQLSGSFPQPVTQPEAPSKTYIIPAGIAEPAPTHEALVEQYVDLASAHERALMLVRGHYGRDFRNQVIMPPLTYHIAYAFLSIAEAMLAEVTAQLEQDTNTLTISRAVAESIFAFSRSTSAESVAFGEFAEWAMKQLIVSSSGSTPEDPEAARLMSNLIAVGLLNVIADDGDELPEHVS